MKKRLTSFLLVLALSFSLSLPAFAVDDIDFYSLPPVEGSEPSVAQVWPLNPSATGDGWSSSDSSRLRDIWQALTDSSSGNAGSIAYCIWWIWNYLKDDIRASLGNIDRNTSVSASRILDSNSLLGSINTAVSGINGYATENTLAGFKSSFSDLFNPAYSITDTGQTTGMRFRIVLPDGKSFYCSFPYFMYYMSGLFSVNGNWKSDLPSIYRMLYLLQNTLASEDDRQLAENYKENREQAESDFLSGKSGKTSLGKGDFSNASQVGGALNDTFNMGGASKVSDFLSGFGSAGTESQAWFSQTTANNLNAVEASDGTQGVTTFADDGENMLDVDSDPYNMANIFDRYDWLEGVNMDD